MSEAREKILVKALADIASNLGRGTIVPSGFDSGSRPLRARASEALKEAGYVYKEYPQVPPDGDGWYLEK